MYVFCSIDKKWLNSNDTIKRCLIERRFGVQIYLAASNVQSQGSRYVLCKFPSIRVSVHIHIRGLIVHVRLSEVKSLPCSKLKPISDTVPRCHIAMLLSRRWCLSSDVAKDFDKQTITRVYVSVVTIYIRAPEYFSQMWQAMFARWMCRCKWVSMRARVRRRDLR